MLSLKDLLFFLFFLCFGYFFKLPSNKSFFCVTQLYFKLNSSMCSNFIVSMFLILKISDKQKDVRKEKKGNIFLFFLSLCSFLSVSLLFSFSFFFLFFIRRRKNSRHKQRKRRKRKKQGTRTELFSPFVFFCFLLFWWEKSLKVFT